ncbi:UNVERIFIED_CONTAM: type IV pilus twitching motility protein PilT [Halobacillus marinus]|uniref:type IV pilus twitching motility protein PilT n=1 Tax=Halobacillus sp. KGW1 TaxID=1793726 RepID=UPI000782F92B|nr:type IV pilus twitching motility protein PilT [Halobacillus sp. KGW1]
MKEQLDELLTLANSYGASDIHMTVGVPPIFRIHGELQRFGEEKVRPEDTEAMAEAILSDVLLEQLRKVREVDVSYGIAGVSRFRINIFYQRNCLSLAVRIVPRNIPTISELHMPDVLKDISMFPQGLVLVTGPTGSGKSTTLASMVDHINQTGKKHIITLEDPIEYTHNHKNSIVDQREIGFDTRNFANGLRACLRQDPDVILVGELRDYETISTALTAAETGHLVLGTLHTTNAPDTIDRIIDVFPPAQQGQVRVQLANVLQAIVSQRLFQTMDRKGRRAAAEVLINTPAIKNLIRNAKIHQIKNVLQTSRANRMQTLEMSILELLGKKVIDERDAAPFLKEGGV